MPLARCSRDAGLTLIEITLRTPAGLPAIRAIRDADVAIDVAIGTVRTPDDMRAAAAAGADRDDQPRHDAGVDRGRARRGAAVVARRRDARAK